MKALVPGAIAIVTAAAVVIGANAVMGRQDATTAEPTARPTVDPACEANPPGGSEFNCLPMDLFILPERPDVTPRGFKVIECEPMTPEELKEYEDATPDPAKDGEDYCVGGGTLAIPDFGPNVPTITINGKVVELPADHSLGHAIPSGVRTITVGNSWVKFTSDGKLRDSSIEPEDQSLMQPILDALVSE